VLAYCRQVAGEANAGPAAADAFARFRATVVSQGLEAGFNPEALLISATRIAAAGMADKSPQEACADVPRLLAERADRSISIGDLERLDEHLAGCWACRAPVARFRAAERAYRDPPEQTVSPAIAAQIVAALAAAVPGVQPHGDAAPALTPATAAPDPGATQAFAIDQPTAEFRALDMLPDDERVAAADGDAPQERSTRRGRTGLATALARKRGARRGRAKGDLAVLNIPAQQPQPAPHLPSARTRGPRLPSLRGRRPGKRRRRALRLPIVLPVVLVIAALLTALFVSGFLGGSDPASSPSVSVPDDAPAQATATPNVVVVPNAKDASADAVELAKARARAEANGEPLPGSTTDAQKQAPAAPSGSANEARTPVAPPPPPPPPVQAQAPAPPPPPPPPAAPTQSASKGTGSKSGSAKSGNATRIDAGSGATGAEQLPAPGDTANVPDLAPPQAGAQP
jgi:hypothetical protein